MSHEEIEPGSLIGLVYEGYRRQLVESYPNSQMRTLADEVFKAYRSAGGNFSPDDMPMLKRIVDEHYSHEQDQNRMIKGAIEAVKIFVRAGVVKVEKKITCKQLPRKGEGAAKRKGGTNREIKAVREHGLKDETVPELNLLREYPDALRPARLPFEFDANRKPPTESGITLLSSISKAPKNEDKKQA